MYSIYFMQASNFIKIGVSQNVKSRIESLQTANHRELAILKEVPMPSRSMAYQTERTLHRLFRKQRIHGEWFVNSEFVKELLTLIETNGYEDLRHNIELAANAVDELGDNSKFDGIDLFSESVIYGDGGFHLNCFGKN
jgi:hypothetical protein